MKFQTTIKLITEAKDKQEAMDIAGEYLSGNLMSGVDMKLRTSPVHRQHIGITLAVAIVFGLLTFQVSHVKHSQNFVRNLPGDSVIQPPLKTSTADKKYSDFKNKWLTRHSQEALNLLK
ncbi:MAG: hypothetical protein PHI58_01095 [Candidatus Omnitrophica bacterium]|nr:hypothetical protein [Candidatus Omnitrophota bacterium]